MQTGQYIVDRKIEEIIPDICRELGIECRSYSDGWIFELQKDQKRRYVYGYKFGANNIANALIVSDKVAAYQLLSSQGINAVEHILVSSKANAYDDWKGKMPGKFVIKPLDGTSGRAVHLVHSVEEVSDFTAKYKDVTSWAISPFEDIKREIRMMMVDGEVVLSYEKGYTELDGLRMFNLGLGAKATNITVSDELKSLASKTIQAVGLRIASVDVAELADGSYKVLEVNDGIMMENYLRQSDEYYGITRDLYMKFVQAMFRD